MVYQLVDKNPAFVLSRNLHIQFTNDAYLDGGQLESGLLINRHCR